jgi:hypothetical protein
MKRRTRKILARISILHAKLFPPKPYVAERWVTGDGVLKETVVSPSTVWPLFAAVAEYRIVTDDPVEVKKMLENGEYPLVTK